MAADEAASRALVVRAAMTFADALAATTGVAPITRRTRDGYLMIGYLDGSVSVTKEHRLVKRLPAGTGPTLGYTDWQPGEHP